MIEVNLLPGGKKGGSKGGGVSLPNFREMFKGGGGGGGGGVDPYIVFFALAALGAVAYSGGTFLGVRGDATELGVQLDEQLADSSRFADQIERMNRLQAQGDSIARRVAVIQEIDSDRYTWSHLLDEVSAAVPDFTWLLELQYAGDDPLTVRIRGRAGTIRAITTFQRRLEASRFLRNVRPENFTQVPSEENPDDLVQEFEFVLTYEPPPMDELESVPLFDEASAQTAAPPGTGN